MTVFGIHIVLHLEDVLFLLLVAALVAALLGTTLVGLTLWAVDGIKKLFGRR